MPFVCYHTCLLLYKYEKTIHKMHGNISVVFCLTLNFNDLAKNYDFIFEKLFWKKNSQTANIDPDPSMFYSSLGSFTII